MITNMSNEEKDAVGLRQKTRWILLLQPGLRIFSGLNRTSCCGHAGNELKCNLRIPIHSFLVERI